MFLRFTQDGQKCKFSLRDNSVEQGPHPVCIEIVVEDTGLRKEAERQPLLGNPQEAGQQSDEFQSP